MFFCNCQVEITQGFNVASQPEHQTSVEVGKVESPPTVTNEIVKDDAAAPVEKSWASLFNKGKHVDSPGEAKAIVNPTKPLALVAPFVQNYVANNKSIIDNLKEPLKSNADDPTLHRLGGLYHLLFVSYKTVTLTQKFLLKAFKIFGVSFAWF